MKRFFLFSLITLSAIVLNAQDQKSPRFDPQVFRQHMERTLTKEAGLTPDEAAAVFPIYNEMREKQRNLGEQIRTIKCQTHADEKEAYKAVIKIKQLQTDMAETEESYYKKMCKTIPASKVMKMMLAEDNLHRRMIQWPRKSQVKQKDQKWWRK
ncbi:MAG: hypothetical protein K6F94_06990 [Bacteroidaceae bacterium]|nr:hypothetical protein [Bacteroidaceae bacterium]